ncbi:helix-turn-helix transcriptional regulator [Solicola sp. PLA-1-18]|uniref:helix-turn-helix transcriptional regulator n=1 Tax=Solicola sp. PLA-1-18 TaxID=3380532 RepID=UPI003B808B41
MTGPTSRLLSLLSLLQARRDWPGSLLAERLEITERTVRRDVDRLRELGYGIRATRGPDGGYRLEGGSELPPLLFDDDQVVALALALQVAGAGHPALEESATRALATVRQVMPSRLRHRLDSVSVTTLASTRTDGDVTPELLQTLGAAVRDRESLRFDYAVPHAEPAGEPAAPRRAEPHHVVSAGSRWYLLAWDLDRGDWRTFRVDRMTLRTPHGPRFAPREVPGGDVADFVAARFKGSTGANAWACQGRAVLALPAAEVAPHVRDGVVEALGPDRCRLSLGAWSWPALAATFGRFDADVGDVEPAELATAFGHLAERFRRASLRKAPPS